MMRWATDKGAVVDHGAEVQAKLLAMVSKPAFDPNTVADKLA